MSKAVPTLSSNCTMSAVPSSSAVCTAVRAVELLKLRNSKAAGLQFVYSHWNVLGLSLPRTRNSSSSAHYVETIYLRASATGTSGLVGTRGYSLSATWS